MPKCIQSIHRKVCLFFTLISLILVGNVYATTATLEWDDSSSAPEGYELYMRMEGKDYNYNQPVYIGKRSSCSINVEKDGVTRYFVVRAYIGSEFSPDSNEVFFTPPVKDKNDPTDSGEDSDEDSDNENLSPHWPKGDRDVDLAPVLILDYKDEELPHTIRWRISTEADMSHSVLSITTTSDKFSLEVPEMVLDADTQYYWQAEFYDKEGVLIDHTEVTSFVTLRADQTEDKNSDGIPDHQMPQEETDLDNDGVPDSQQADLMCVKTATGNGKIGVKSLSSDASLVAVKSVADIDYSNTLNKPEIMTYGLLSFKLFLNDGVDSADVTVFFSEPVDPEARWYKYDSKEGWRVFEEAVFSTDRKSVTFTLVDGGFGDEDGIRNGIIVDPSGIGIMSQADDAAPEAINSSSSSNGGSGCYIDTLSTKKQADKTAAGHLIILAGMLLLGLGSLSAKCSK